MMFQFAFLRNLRLHEMIMFRPKYAAATYMSV
jgi:hypothetical protein